MIEGTRGLGPVLGILMLVFGVLVLALPQLLVWVVGLTLIVGGLFLVLGTWGALGSRRSAGPGYGRI